MGIMEKKMETTIVYRVNMRIHGFRCRAFCCSELKLQRG